MAVEDLTKLVETELGQVNERILEACKNHVELIPEVASHLIAAGGKRIRPIFTLASAKLCEYRGHRHINLAASVEFMHTATLLHDDVVDESAKRRGMETANNIWGNKASVLVGDYLLGKAFQMMVSDGSLSVLKILSDAAAKIAEGEVLQLSTTNNINTTIETYIEVVKAKTAELFAAACEVGAAIIEDEPKRKALRAFGENFGIAFQVIDDALDYSANPEKFGKTIGDDFREGKVTLPVIFAYEMADAEGRKFWEAIIEEGANIGAAELAQAQERISKTGAYKKTIEFAQNYAAKSISSLDIFLESATKAALISVVKSSINRDF
jgi:octaprenyl-diphosphate synthase